MIFYVTGPLGAGKSFYVVRKMAKALLEGKAVAGNVTLREDWAHILASHNPYTWASRDRKREYVRELESRYHYSDDIEFLTHLKLKGRGEGRGLLALDEAHNSLNNLDYMREETKEMLRWITLTRKKGWYVYIVSQHAGNTLRGLRNIATVQIRLVNWKQVTKFPFLEMSLLPFPVFLATARPNEEAFSKTAAARKRRPLFRELFFLSWHRKLYDTFELFGEEEFDEFAYYLPSPPESRAVVRAHWKFRQKEDAIENGKAPSVEGASVRVVRPPRGNRG